MTFLALCNNEDEQIINADESEYIEKYNARFNAENAYVDTMMNAQQMIIDFCLK